MARHHSYSKRSRESRKAMTDGTDDDDHLDDAYLDRCDCMTEDLSPVTRDVSVPPGPVS